jgi:hypothetical protein
MADLAVKWKYANADLYDVYYSYHLINYLRTEHVRNLSMESSVLVDDCHAHDLESF